VAFDTRSLSRVIEYPHADMTITVEAGITAAALRRVLAEQNQRLQIDVPQADRATLGGVFATNTCGSRRFGLGRPRDQIIGVGFVTSEGALVKGGGRVVKNVAGYDFPRLLTGSLGTLGIIAQMTFKVRPLPEASAVLWVGYTEPDTLADALDGLNTSGSRPVALDLLNRSAAQSIGGPVDLPAADWVLAIGLEDNAASVAWQISRLKSELGPASIIVREGADSIGAWSGLTEFQAAEPGPISCVVSIPPSTVSRYVQKADPGRWSVQVHAGNGIVRMHAQGDWTLDEAKAAVTHLRGLAQSDDGSLVLSRCPTNWKERLRVWGDPRPDWGLAKRVKAALDPRGAMNPGRFVGDI
jgi:glycolate oxidase FAD binding subunit